MKITSIEEYGLRLLLRIARNPVPGGMSIAMLSQEEGLSEPYVAKITRILRIAGFVKSKRGKTGGYILSRPAEEIRVAEVLHALDGKLFDDLFCGGHTGTSTFCTNSVDCSVRSLWQLIQTSLDQVLAHVTLADLIGDGKSSGMIAALRMNQIVDTSEATDQ